MHHRQIALAELPLPHLLRQQRRRLTAAGKDHQPAGLGVQTVNGADTVSAQRLPQKRGHAARLVGGQHTVGLYRHHNPHVLINDRQASSS